MLCWNREDCITRDAFAQLRPLDAVGGSAADNDPHEMLIIVKICFMYSDVVVPGTSDIGVLPTLPMPILPS